MIYRREIDGLRAIAVLAVILFHAGVSGFSGGFVGVDVFFVISGYLITSIIIEEKNKGRFTLAHFYERRARRILPALFVVFLATAIGAYLIQTPRHLAEFGSSLRYALVFISNIFFYRESGYFDTAAELKPILHTWSLAIEEQYYILFPLLLLALLKLRHNLHLIALAVIGGVSLVYASSLASIKPEAAFFLLPSRAWELLVGAIAAATALHYKKSLPIAPSSQNSHWLNIAFNLLPLSGLAMIGVATFTYNESTPFPGYYALLPTFGTLLIILFASPQTAAGKLIGSRPLVFIGLISYSAYLWHQPILALCRHVFEKELPPIVSAAALASVALLAYLSWRLVEQPFRHAGTITRRQFLTSIIAAGLPLLIFGHYAKTTKGFEEYYYHHRVSPKEREIYGLLKAHTNKKFKPEEVDNGDCNFRSESIDNAFRQRFADCTKKYGKAVIVLGDSHAINVYNALFRTNFDKFLVGVAKGACRPYYNRPFCQYNDFDRFVEEQGQHVRYVLYHQAGSYLVETLAGEAAKDGIFQGIGEYRFAESNIRGSMTYLDALSRRVKVIWLGPFTEARVDFEDPRNFLDGFFINKISIDIFSALEARLTQVTQNAPWGYLSSHAIMPISSDFLRQGDCITFMDKDHFSSCGEVIYGNHLKQALPRR